MSGLSHPTLCIHAYYTQEKFNLWLSLGSYVLDNHTGLNPGPYRHCPVLNSLSLQFRYLRVMAPQITGNLTISSTARSGYQQIKIKRSALSTFCSGNKPVGSGFLTKGPVKNISWKGLLWSVSFAPITVVIAIDQKGIDIIKIALQWGTTRG